MDIRMQCGGVVLMAVLLYFYLRQKRISLDTEKVFFRALLVTFVCIILDIFSILALDYRSRLPELLVRFICKSYLVTLMGVAYCGLLYVCVDIYKKKNYRKNVRKYKLAALAGMILIYFLPMEYRFAADQTTVIYTYGASVYTTYLFAVGFLIVNFFLMNKENNKNNTARREAVLMCMSIWIASSLIQLFNSNLLIVGFMSAIGTAIVYLKLENPETNLDRQSGMFNHGALIQYGRQLFGREQAFSVLTLSLEEPLHKSMRADRTGAADMEMLEFLLHVPDAFIFKNTENEILFVFEDQEKAGEQVRLVSQRFQSGWGKDGQFYVKHCWIYMADAGIVNNVDDMLDLIQCIRQDSAGFAKNSLIVADQARAEKMYQMKKTERLLAEAIEKDRVEVFYQPIFSTRENRFTCAEALVRIRDESGNIVPPGAFIEVAEQNGAILKLGEMIFEKVCRMIGERDIRRYGLHYLEINLSVVQCASEHLFKDYIQIMEKYGIAAEQINLEITESASLDAKAVLLQNMEKMIAHGVRFSLDDFGTGQSNLNYIMDMPVDIVKFDMDMTSSYFKNSKAKYIMDNAIRMIHGMGLEIVSEGVETEEQYQTMKSLGISYIQGYYFSKPLSQEEFWQFIEERNGRLKKAAEPGQSVDFTRSIILPPNVKTASGMVPK